MHTRPERGGGSSHAHRYRSAPGPPQGQDAGVVPSGRVRPGGHQEPPDVGQIPRCSRSVRRRPGGLFLPLARSGGAGRKVAVWRRRRPAAPGRDLAWAWALARLGRSLEAAASGGRRGRAEVAGRRPGRGQRPPPAPGAPASLGRLRPPSANRGGRRPPLSGPGAAEASRGAAEGRRKRRERSGRGPAVTRGAAAPPICGR